MKGWKKCTDDEYPDINQRFILVRYKEDNSNFYYYIYADCPYGWNVLQRKNAEFMVLRIA